MTTAEKFCVYLVPRKWLNCLIVVVRQWDFSGLSRIYFENQNMFEAARAFYKPQNSFYCNILFKLIE